MNLLGENYGRNNFYQGGFSTMKIPKELIKEYVKSENFTNTNDIMESIKSMFADVLNTNRQKGEYKQLHEAIPKR